MPLAPPVVRFVSRLVPALLVAGCSAGSPPPGSATIFTPPHQVTIAARPHRGDSLKLRTIVAASRAAPGRVRLTWRLMPGQTGAIFFRANGARKRWWLGRVTGDGSLLFNYVVPHRDYAFVLHLLGGIHRPVAVTYLNAH